MNRKIIAFAAVCAAFAAALLVGCGTKSAGTPVVRVGRVVLSEQDIEAFGAAFRNFPASMPHFFPAHRPPATFMLETEALYQYARRGTGAARARALEAEISASLDWTWKTRFYTAALFVDQLQTNLGFTDAQLEAYYRRNTDAFRAVTAASDGSDSSFVVPFEDAKRRVADELFYVTFPPDDAFLASISGHAHDHDEEMIRSHWLYNVRSNPQDFFMRRFFAEKTGAEYSDDISQIFGEDGQPLTPADLDVITLWLPPTHRNMSVRERVEWLYKWLLFSERAATTGLTVSHRAELQNSLHWAMRMEFALAYLRENVLTDIDSAFAASDTTLAELLVSDRTRSAAVSPSAVESELGNILRMRVNTVVDSAMHGVRRAVGVVFLNDEHDDGRDADAAVLSARADSLKDASLDMFPDAAAPLISEAEAVFGRLADDFAFTAEGRRAMGDFAHGMLDRFAEDGGFGASRTFGAAIGLYRRAQMLERDIENLCGLHFLAGHAYDEHMKDYALAEANFRWILRHAPDCALASDAEFMIQNLGEPTALASLEEMRAQAVRQGRPVDFEDDGEGERSEP